MNLLARAVLAFLILPGMVAFVVPVLFLRPWTGGRFIEPLGLVPLTAGLAVLFWCVVEFYRVGRGTLAPWAPPRHLVVTGPYRFSRNPMYVAVLLVLCGWAIGYRSGILAIYAAAVAAVFHLRVRLGEEPYLARTHGTDWVAYSISARRWL